MKRILALWLPHWPVQRLVHDQAELAGRALVLYEKDARYGNRVKTCSAAATELGVRSAMPLAEAQTLLALEASQTPRERPQFILHDPRRDREALTCLAEWCERFSPIVGLDQSDEPDSLLLGIDGLAHLFGGEQELARTVVTAFGQRGLIARVAIADTLRAAWAVARWGDCSSDRQTSADPLETQREGNTGTASTPDAAKHVPARGISSPQVRSPARKRCEDDENRINSKLQTKQGSQRCLTVLVPPGDVVTVDSLPLTALQLPQRTSEQLQRLGLRNIGQLRQLSRVSLAARFGDLPVERLDQLTGSVQQVIVSHRRQGDFSSYWSFEHPTTRHDTIEYVLEELLRRLSSQLVERGQGAQQLKCQLRCKDYRPLDIDIGLFQPTVNAQHLAALAKMQLALLRLPGAVEEVRVAALSTAACQQRQKELFADSPRDQPAQLAPLVERLSNRMGREHVVRAQLKPEPLAESAYQYFPLTGARSSAKPADSAATYVHRPMLRPLWLLEPPQRIEMVGIALDGPPAMFHCCRRQYRVARCFGPERIETGWWRGPSQRRDYYRVETDGGNRLWLFRNLQDKRWFLHGEF